MPSGAAQNPTATTHAGGERERRHIVGEKDLVSAMIKQAASASPASVSGTAKIELPILGMTCAHCAETLHEHLKTMLGVKEARVNVKTARATMTYDAGQVKVADLVAAIRACGYQAGVSATTLRVKGIYCAGCISQIEDALKRTPGVLTA